LILSAAGQAKKKSQQQFLKFKVLGAWSFNRYLKSPWGQNLCLPQALIKHFTGEITAARVVHLLN